MKTILWMGMSLNGYIARDNREEDFISDECWLVWIKAVKECGCIVWGRKTYQIVEKWPPHYFNDLKGIKVIVISKNHNLKLKEGFELASSPEAALTKLSNYGFKSTIVTGGSTVNSSFAKSNLLDEVVLLIEPVVVGKGIPVFNPDIFDLKLRLANFNQLDQNRIILKYAVDK